MNNVSRFEDLDVFQRAYKASLEIHQLSLTLPELERYVLADQLRRASRSIPSNIAEGYGKRRSSAEFKRFIQMAIGSADEMRVWLRYCLDLNYIDDTQWDSLKQEYQEIAKMLNAFYQRIN
jgi:four helix bundle protein